MRWLWVSALFTAFFWLRTIPVFTRGEDGWVWLVIGAIGAAALGLRRVPVEQFDLRWLVGLIPLGMGVWQLPFPYDVPVILVILAVLLFATMRFSQALAWVGVPFVVVALMLSVQSAVIPLIYILSSRVHEISWLSPLFYGLARLFDPGVSLSGHQVIVHYVNEVFEFPTRLEALGLFPVSLIASAGLVLLIAKRRPLRILAAFLGLMVGYSVLRYLFLVFLTVKFNTYDIFWRPVSTALSYVPLIVLLASIDWFRESRSRPSLGLAWPGSRTFAGLILVAAGAIGVTGLFAYHDAGTRKQGRILIDEFHSDWEWTTEKYDTRWYGRKSGYNYYCMAEYLRHYYLVEAHADSLLPEVLVGYDIVMLKTPTSPYSEREIAALVEFVRQGGGLWLIGDHTNVFGTSTYLNPLARRFGLRFRYDATYDLKTMALSVYERPCIFPHPTVAFLPTFLFATSCSMEGPLFSENMVLGYGLKAGHLDYSQKGFFPRKDSKNYGFGLFIQQGGVKYGKGRVAGFTDSTVFSNFFMFIPGKPELALATLEWLNRINRFAWADKALLAGGLLCLVAAGTVIRRWNGSQQALVVLSGSFLGLAIAVMLFDGHVRRSYPLPAPHTRYVHVAFEAEHSDITLPTLELTKHPDRSLHTFFVWTQRLGFFPSFEPTLEDALARGDLVVIANPAVPFEQDEIDRAVSYVSKGGRLLILVDALNQAYVTRGLLGPLGIRLPSPYEERDTEPDGEKIEILGPAGEKLADSARPAGLEGGIPILRLSNDDVVLVEAKIGKGRVFVFSDFCVFTDENMGHTGEMPDERRLGISELEYWILRRIMDLPQPAS
jgi:hypothetical protein